MFKRQAIETQGIEPGLLQIFRLYTAVQWVLLSLSMLSLLSKNAPPEPNYFTIFGWGQTTFLLIYLVLKSLPGLLGKFYLPIALGVASFGPIVWQGLATAIKIQQGNVGEAALVDSSLFYTWLLLPLLLVCAQYGVWTMLAFTALTSLLPVVVAAILAQQGGPGVTSHAEHALIRLFLFGVTGFVVVKLSVAQRKQRAELAEKNAQLAHYATTLEQLTISQERNRMARELHDTLAHTLSAVNVQLKALEVLLDTNPAAAHTALQQTQELTRNGLHEARRALHDLRIKPVEELGLVLAIQGLAKTVGERAGLQVRLDLPAQLNYLTPQVEQNLYRITQEALNNVVRHANARNVAVALCQDAARLELVISDDGLGFEPEQVVPPNHYGMAGMRERATLMGGKLEILSKPRQGTTVRLKIEG